MSNIPRSGGKNHSTTKPLAKNGHWHRSSSRGCQTGLLTRRQTGFWGIFKLFRLKMNAIRVFLDFKGVHENITIQYNTEKFYSAGILGVAKFKGASSQNPSNRKLKSRGKPYSSSRDREINWLRRIRYRPKRCVFQTLTKTSQGFRRADRQGKFVPERRKHCVNKSSHKKICSVRYIWYVVFFFLPGTTD